jgi:hypothetical protein
VVHSPVPCGLVWCDGSHRALQRLGRVSTSFRSQLAYSYGSGIWARSVLLRLLLHSSFPAFCKRTRFRTVHEAVWPLGVVLSATASGALVAAIPSGSDRTDALDLQATAVRTCTSRQTSSWSFCRPPKAAFVLGPMIPVVLIAVMTAVRYGDIGATAVSLAKSRSVTVMSSTLSRSVRLAQAAGRRSSSTTTLRQRPWK